MRFNTRCGVLVPASGQRQVVFDDMKLLCNQYFPDEYEEIQARFAAPAEEKREGDNDLELKEELEEGNTEGYHFSGIGPRTFRDIFEISSRT